MFSRYFLRRVHCLVALMLCIAPLPLFAAELPDSGSVLLVAADEMLDPRFRQAVVLVTRHGRSRSPIGVIFNRAFEVSVEQVLPGMPQAAQHRLHYGGPVGQGQIVFLLRGESAPGGAIAVGEHLFLSSHVGSLLQLLAAPTPASHLRVFKGFASWAPSQLESEIGRGDWYVLPVDADTLFGDPLDGLWLKLWRRATMVTVEAPYQAPEAGGARLASR